MATKVIEIPLKIKGVEEAKKQLEQLQESAKVSAGDGIKSINDDIKTLENTLEGVNEEFAKTIEETGELNDYFVRTADGSINAKKSIQQLTKQLQSMKLEGKDNTEEYQRMSLALGEMKDTVIEANRDINTLSGKGLPALATGLQNVGRDILSLDFGASAESAMTLNKQMTNLGSHVQDALSGLASTVKSLTQTFVKLGVALVSNPIFLIAGAITALVGVVVLLMNKLGLLQPIIDGVKKAFDVLKKGVEAIIQGFKDLTDWLGITDNKGKEYAKNQVEAMAKVAEASKKATESRVFDLDRESRLAQARGEDTINIEKRKQQAILDGARAEKKANEQALKIGMAKGILDKEQIKDLKEKIKLSSDLIKNTKVEIEVIDERINTEGAKQLEEQAKANAERAKQAEEQAKKYAQDRLNYERLVGDLMLEAITDQQEKEISLNQTKYTRLIEDTKRNESLLASEKKALIEIYTRQQAEQEEAIKKTYKDKEVEAEKAFIQSMQEVINSGEKSEFEKIEENRTKRLEALKKGLTDEQLQRQEYLNAVAEIERQAQAQKIEAEKAFIQLMQDVMNSGEKTDLEKIEESRVKRLEALKKGLTDEQLQRQEYLNAVAEIERQAEAERQRLIDESTEQEKAKRKSVAEASIGAISNMLSAISALQEAKMESDLANAEGNEAKQREIRRKAFEDNKKMQIAQASIQMITGAVSAFAGAMQLGPIAGPIIGAILAAAVVATGVANIAKIKATKFESGGGASASATAGASATAVKDTAPQINMFGSAGNYNEGSEPKPTEQKEIKVVAEVSEYEISQSQKTVNKQQERASL